MNVRILGIAGIMMLLIGCTSRHWVPDRNPNCVQCRGGGQYICPTCNGTCYAGSCNPCRGSGRAVCTGCEGARTVPDKKGNARSCSYCNGTGQGDCRSCGGNGRQPCPNCTGKGKMECGTWVEDKKDP